MTQSELNDAVSQATGESVEDIQHMGFSLVANFPEGDFGLESFEHPDPQVVDWDSPIVGATQSVYECC